MAPIQRRLVLFFSSKVEAALFRLGSMHRREQTTK